MASDAKPTCGAGSRHSSSDNRLLSASLRPRRSCDNVNKSSIDAHSPSAAPKLLRPRDASTLIIVDRSNDHIRVLMGKRRMEQVFMPGKYVFPGGRVDKTDRLVQSADELSDLETSKLMLEMKGSASAVARGRSFWQPFARRSKRPGLSSARPSPDLLPRRKFRVGVIFSLTALSRPSARCRCLLVRSHRQDGPAVMTRGSFVWMRMPSPIERTPTMANSPGCIG